MLTDMKKLTSIVTVIVLMPTGHETMKLPQIICHTIVTTYS